MKRIFVQQIEEAITLLNNPEKASHIASRDSTPKTKCYREFLLNLTIPLLTNLSNTFPEYKPLCETLTKEINETKEMADSPEYKWDDSLHIVWLDGANAAIPQLMNIRNMLIIDSEKEKNNA